MKGTLISILVGALAGVLITVGSSMHASHAAPSRAEPSHSGLVSSAHKAADPTSDAAVTPATSIEQASRGANSSQ
jgi:hypothetical protein